MTLAVYAITRPGKASVFFREKANAERWIANAGDQSAAIVELVPASDRTAQAEPVAWRVHTFDYGVGVEGVYALTMREEQVSAWGRKLWDVEPLYAAPRLPRDVLMAVASEVRHAAVNTDRLIDIDAIVDRHAAKAEPVNKQMLSVLKRIVDTCNSADFDGEPSAAEMKAAEEAIAAAESAQAQQERIAKDAALIESMNRIAGLEKKAALHDQLMRACGELPEGWEIVIELENGAGTVSLFDPAYREVEYPEDSENMAQAVEYAIDTAIAAQAQEGGA